MARHKVELPNSVPPSRWFAIGLVLLLLFGAFVLIRPYLGAIVLAVLIGYLMQPVHRRILAVVRFPAVAATIGLALVTLALVLPIVFIVRALVDEVQGVVDFAQDPEGLRASIDGLAQQFGLSPQEADTFVERALAGLAGAVQTALVPTLNAAVDVVAGLVLFFFILWFTLRDGEAFALAMKRVTPLSETTRDHLYKLIGARTRAIALGTFLVSIAQGLAAGLGWWYFGFPAPVFWGFVMTVIAVLPLGAPFLVMVPAGLIAIAQGDLYAGIGLIVYAAVVVGLLDNFLRPFVVSHGSDAHPAIILIGTIGGLTVFGVSGFLIGPLLLSLLGPAIQAWAEERRAMAA